MNPNLHRSVMYWGPCPNWIKRVEVHQVLKKAMEVALELCSAQPGDTGDLSVQPGAPEPPAQDPAV
jgi:hypothetical protein